MKKISIYHLVTCAIMAAIMCCLGPLTIPIGPVPVSLTNLVILIAVVLLGWKGGVISTAIYILLGFIGLPVFSGFQGGPAKLAGPTGGYIVAWILLALISGLFVEKFRNKPVIVGFGMALGTVVLYFFGTIWFMILMKCNLMYALTLCVFPFVVFDLIKIVAAIVFGGAIYKALLKAGLIKR